MAAIYQSSEPLACSGSRESYKLTCWDQTYQNTAVPAVTFNKWNKQSQRRPASFFAPSLTLCEVLRMENLTLPWKHEGRELSVLSNMSHLSSTLSYGTRCFNRTIWGTGNLQSSACLCLAVNLAMTWWMSEYQSKRFSLTKDPDPVFLLSLPLALLLICSSITSSVFLLFFPVILYAVSFVSLFLLVPVHCLCFSHTSSVSL